MTAQPADSPSSWTREVGAAPGDRTSSAPLELARFVLLVVVAHTTTYFAVGALAFATLTHGLYEGADPLFGAYLRTPGETGLWQHVTTWFLPAQLLRGLLIGLALSPFLTTLRRWSIGRRTLHRFSAVRVSPDLPPLSLRSISRWVFQRGDQNIPDSP